MILMSKLIQNRYQRMRSLLRIIDIHDWVLLDLDAGSNPITDELPYINRTLVDVQPKHKLTIVSNLYSGIALAEACK